MAFTAFKSFRLDRGLSLEARPRATTYVAVARINGTVNRENMETSDYDRAERKARSWFSRLNADHVPGSREHVTMHDAAQHFLRYGIRASTPTKTEAKHKYHKAKWHAVSDFFKAMDVDAVTTPVLKAFMRWDKRSHVKPITVRKYFVTIRLILRHAVEEGWLTVLPVFPRVGTVESNPRPWFEPDQWRHLQDEAIERMECAKDEPGKHRHSRMDLLDFMRLMVATCMRVDELRSVRVRDVTIVRDTTKVTYGGMELPPNVARLAKQRPDTREYLEIALQQGKTGPRTVLTRLADSGVETFRALVARKHLTPDDLLFAEHHRDAFRELLIAANLRTDGNGHRRNLKSLRSTGMMLWILQYPNANIKMLAATWGTSMEMISAYYLKRLDVQVNRHAIVG